MIVTPGQLRSVIVFVLGETYTGEGYDDVLLRIFEGDTKVGCDRIQLKEKARIFGDIRRTVINFYGRKTAIRASAYGFGNDPGQITTRRLVVEECADRFGRTRFRGRVISGFLDFTFNGRAYFSVALRMSVGRNEGSTSTRYDAILDFSDYGVTRVRPLDNFLNIYYKLKGVGTMTFYRFFRVFGDICLGLSFLTGTSGVVHRDTITTIYRVFGFVFGGRIGAMGDGATVITCSSTTTMDVQGANSGLVITNLRRLKDMDVGGDLIVYS